MNEHKITSIGVFIDGGYYAKINQALEEQHALQINLAHLFDYIRQQVAQLNNQEKADCIITQAHYYRGRFKAGDAGAMHLLYKERRFEDELIENDVIFHYKHLRQIKNKDEVTIVEKGVDVWFALEAYQLSQIHQLDYVILITGDADHEMLVRKLQTGKHHVILLTWNLGPQSATSRFLREEVWKHIELSNECNIDNTLRHRLCKAIPIE